VTTWLKIERTSEGVRRIPLNVRSLTGSVQGQEFESSLERDLLLLVHWDNEVDWYQSQPLRIDYFDCDNYSRNYTPDLLISYKNQRSDDLAGKRPLLCEVKYRADLAKDWKILKPKLKAAREYSKSNGYEFRIFTEREIRTPYLKNVQFLWSYKFAHFHQHHYEKLHLTLEEIGETDITTLLECCYSSQTLRSEALWTMWCMIARHWVQCDITIPLKMNTRIWINHE
jgi:hypothetical protein